MAVYEQKSKGGTTHWAIDFIWSDPATGQSKRIRRAAKDAKGRPAKSRTAAEQHELRIRAQLAGGTFEVATTEPSAVPTLATYHATHLEEARVRLKPQTIDYLQRTFRNAILPTLGSTPIDQIDFAAFERLTKALHARELKPKTINNALSALRATLSHAVKHRRLAQVPHVQWQKLTPTKFDFFSFDEVALLVPAALAEGVPLLVLGVRTGMRIGELLELKWSDIALDRQQVTVSRSVWWKTGGKRVVGAPKNHKARTIPLSADAMSALQLTPVAKRFGYVFADDQGLPLTPSQLRWPIWRAQDAAQLRRTGPHVLRHTFASHLVMKGVPLPAVQALMGHSTIQMTMKYAHLAPDHLRAAIATLG